MAKKTTATTASGGEIILDRFLAMRRCRSVRMTPGTTVGLLLVFWHGPLFFVVVIAC
jgi:hypothetical protein